MKNIKLSSIRLDGGTQVRAKIDQAVLSDYETQIREGSTFPPITVFEDDDGKFWLADGFHRYFAHDMAEASEITCDVRTGSLRDAIKYGLSANANHGLRRSNEDKRRAVQIALEDPEWTLLSDREIAEMCVVSHPLVSRLRRGLGESESGNVSTLETRINELDGEIRNSLRSGNVSTLQEEHEELPATDYNKKESSKTVHPPCVEGVTEPSTAASPASSRNKSEKPPLSEVESLRARVNELEDKLYEIGDELSELVKENESLGRVSESSDQISASLAEAKRFREENRVLKERINGLTNEKAEAVRLAKYWKKKAEGK